MKTKLTLLIVILIIVPLTFIGCKTELTERITELEGKLAEEENKIVQEEVAEVEEEEAPPAIYTDTMPVEETATEEEEVAEEEVEEEDSNIEKVAPTISLAIYEGPILDGSICYYRIEATVTGSPNPTVSFSKDDSGGAWGSKKVQINLNDPTDTYTLTATATNSEGSATDTIALSWGCEIPDPDPDPDSDPIEKDLDIGADTTISGFIYGNSSIESGAAYLFIGDDSDIQTITFLSFDISSISNLDNATIKDVTTIIPIDIISGDPHQLGPVNIYVFYYGSLDYIPIPLIGGELVKTIYTTGSLTDFNFSSNELKEELQKRVDKGRYWFQLEIVLSGGINNNGLNDYYRFRTSDIIIHIKYEIPG